MSGHPWYPNREAYIVKECGCIDIPWGAVHKLGDCKGRERIFRLNCEEHPSPNPLGWAIREATYADIARFRGWQESNQSRLF
jgi:hypothetical protein